MLPPGFVTMEELLAFRVFECFVMAQGHLSALAEDALEKFGRIEDPIRSASTGRLLAEFATDFDAFTSASASIRIARDSQGNLQSPPAARFWMPSAKTALEHFSAMEMTVEAIAAYAEEDAAARRPTAVPE